MENNRIIVIGGGPAGSSVSSYLAMKGYEVVLFEKEKFPRPHVGESLLPFNYELFQDLGVLENMEMDYHRKPGVKFSSSDGSRSTTWYFEDVIKHESSLSFHVDREKFDNMLLERSRELGVTVHEQTAVVDTDFDRPDGRVKVTTRSRSGEMAEHMAEFVIDASGQNTFLANKFKDKHSYEGLGRVALNTHWQNPQYDKELAEGCIEIIHTGGEKMGWIWAIPIASDRVSVGVVMSGDYFKAQRIAFSGDKEFLDKLYMQELSESALMTSILKNATKERSPMANGDYSYYTTKKYGDNFAVVGDASSFLDPIFSSGIYIAMFNAKLIAENLDEAFKTPGLKPSETLKSTYEMLQDTYDLIEKLIRIWYDPNAISLANLSEVQNIEYEKFHSVYKIYHYLLQGDFVRNAKKYTKAADILLDSRQLEKYTNFVNKKEAIAIHTS